jgi:asparagine synthase (glutamine-hydrolysing)
MCGLAGWLGSPSGPVDEAAILASLKHRGPDGTGALERPQARLLHTRLKIIDLSPTGAQPMANEDSSVFVVFNGEIYNHKELRRELESRGHVFRGTSDTEVLPHLYEEYGSELFRRLRGMFSIAIYDAAKGTLLLARDRFGIKPLYYTCNRRCVAFASELNALRLIPGVDLAVDRQAVSDYAALFYVPAPRTIFRGIRALEPGRLLEARIGRNGVVETNSRAFHSWSTEPRFDLTLEEAAAEADRLVGAAVAQQLESDVPLGTLLSGGIDSSLVSAAAKEHLNGSLQTFNVGFGEPRFDETAAARAVAAHIGARHTTLNMPNRSGGWAHVMSLFGHAGQPFADTSLFGVDAVSQAMRRHVTVALSGDGGDEGFGGYDLYRRLGTIERLRRMPVSAGEGLAHAARLAVKLRSARQTLPQRITEFTASDETGVAEALFAWIRGAEHRRLVVDADDLEPPRRLFERQWSNGFGSALDRLSAHAAEVNVRLVLPNDFLFKVDTASMRHSLEVRVPMLDEDLVAFGLSLPHALRANRRTGKIVLRAVAERKLPPEIARKPKWGFGVPVDRWVDREFKENARATVLDRASALPEYLNQNAYEEWVRALDSDDGIPGVTRTDIYRRVMMLLSLDLVLRGH